MWKSVVVICASHHYIISYYENRICIFFRRVRFDYCFHLIRRHTPIHASCLHQIDDVVWTEKGNAGLVELQTSTLFYRPTTKLKDTCSSFKISQVFKCRRASVGLQPIMNWSSIDWPIFSPPPPSLRRITHVPHYRPWSPTLSSSSHTGSCLRRDDVHTAFVTALPVCLAVFLVQSRIILTEGSPQNTWTKTSFSTPWP